MKKCLFLCAVVLSLTSVVGCGHHVVRDTNAYKAELAFTDNLMKSQARIIEEMVKLNCSCNAEKKWSSVMCENAADVYAVFADRWQWHLDMQRHLGLGTDRPSKTPPPIRSASEMCDAFKEGSD